MWFVNVSVMYGWFVLSIVCYVVVCFLIDRLVRNGVGMMFV